MHARCYLDIPEQGMPHTFEPFSLLLRTYVLSFLELNVCIEALRNISTTQHKEPTSTLYVCY